MEAFEHIVKVFLEFQGYVVTTNIKFPVRRKTKKAKYEEYQTHGYEVDIIGAKADSLLLGSVKSFFGSGGVNRQGFKGIADTTKKTYYDQYKMFNVPEIYKGILVEASKRYGYPLKQIQVCLFVGNFSSGEEQLITRYLENKQIEVYDLRTIVNGLLKASKPSTYTNDPVLVTVKALQMAGLLTEQSN